MSQQKYTFGYELQSKQVRRYQVNDWAAIMHALTVNTQEYLAYLGCEEDTQSTGSIIAILAVLTALSLTMMLSINFWPEQAAKLLALGVVNISCVAAIFYDNWMRFPPDVAFVCSGVITPRPELTENRISGLSGQRWCVTLRCDECSSSFCFRASILQDASYWRYAHEKCSVSKSVLYSTYFNSEGYIFPPALTHDIDDLLKELMDKCNDNVVKR